MTAEGELTKSLIQYYGDISVEEAEKQAQMMAENLRGYVNKDFSLSADTVEVIVTGTAKQMREYIPRVNEIQQEFAKKTKIKRKASRYDNNAKSYHS